MFQMGGPGSFWCEMFFVAEKGAQQSSYKNLMKSPKMI